MFIVQQDLRRSVPVDRKVVQRTRLATFTDNGIANFPRKGIDMLRVVTIFRVYGSSFSKQWLTHKQYSKEKCSHCDHDNVSALN